MSNGVEDRLNYLEETKGLIKQSIANFDNTITNNTPFSEYPNYIQNIINNSIIPQSELDALVIEAININGEEPSPELPYLENITAGSVYEFTFQDIPLGINDITQEEAGNYITNNMVIDFHLNNYDLNDWLNIINENPNLVPVDEMISYEIGPIEFLGLEANFPFTENKTNYYVGYVPNWFVSNQELANEYNLHNVGWYKFPEERSAYNFANGTPTNTPVITGIPNGFYVYTGYNPTTEENFNWVTSVNTENFRYLFKSIKVSNLPVRPNI